MDRSELLDLARSIAPVIRDHAAKAVEDLSARISALEARIIERGDKGEPGKDGVDGLRGEQGLDGKDGADGKDGIDGKDGDPGKDGEKGIDGKDGEPGQMGEKGDKGEPGEPAAPITKEQLVEAIRSMPELFAEAAVDYFKANPVANGKDGKDGRDGVGLAGALIDRDGDLVVTLTDGTSKKLGMVIGKDGAPGRDGNDGFGLEDFSAESLDDGRTITLTFARGDLVKTYDIKTAIQLYQSLWKDGKYLKGDAVTFGGSQWIALKDTTTKPDTPDSDWRLAVKRGRDGKDGKTGEKGMDGKQGPPGRDGRQF